MSLIGTTPAPRYIDIERHGGRKMVASIAPIVDLAKPGDFIECRRVKSDGELAETHYLNPRGISAVTIVTLARAKQLAQIREVEAGS